MPFSRYHLAILAQAASRDPCSADNVRLKRGADTSPPVPLLPEDPRDVDPGRFEFDARHTTPGILPEMEPFQAEDVPDQSPLVPGGGSDDHLQASEVLASDNISVIDEGVHQEGSFQEAYEEKEVSLEELNELATEKGVHNSQESDVTGVPTIPLTNLPTAPAPTTHTSPKGGLDGTCWQTGGTARTRKSNSRFTGAIFTITNALDQFTGRIRPTAQVFRIVQSPKQAVRERGAVALKAVFDEVFQLGVTMDIFEPKHLRDLTNDEKSRILPSFSFVEQKFDATTSEYVKDKSRLVGGGHRQLKSEFIDNWSPTVNTSALFIGAGIAAKEHRHVASLDVPGAYLRAKFKPDDEVVHVTLEPLEAQILVMLRPEFLPYLLPNGKMVVKLTRALYGLIESAKMWYDEVTTTLEGEGYVRNPHDLCVYNKVVNGVQISVYLHVDDMMITSTEEQLITDLYQTLHAKYDPENKMVLKTGKMVFLFGYVI